MKRLCAFDIERDRKGEHLISAGWAIYTTDTQKTQKQPLLIKQLGSCPYISDRPRA